MLSEVSEEFCYLNLCYLLLQRFYFYVFYVIFDSLYYCADVCETK